MRPKLVNEHDTGKLRSNVYLRFSEWQRKGLLEEIPWDDKSPVGILIRLLGFRNLQDMLTNYHEDSVRLVEGLAGPHGYTFYKALLIKRLGK